MKAQAGDLPDKRLTPGAVRPLSHATICSTIWSRDRRFVTARMKLNVYHSYKMIGPKDKACVPDAHGRRCEIDHLVPRSLGGADEPKNLWPQPFGTKPWNAARKDRLEVKLSRMVCKSQLKLKLHVACWSGIIELPIVASSAIRRRRQWQ